MTWVKVSLGQIDAVGKRRRCAHARRASAEALSTKLDVGNSKDALVDLRGDLVGLRSKSSRHLHGMDGQDAYRQAPKPDGSILWCTLRAWVEWEGHKHFVIVFVADL